MTDETRETTNPAEEPKAENNPLKVFLEHQKKALEETSKAIEALLPEGFREHGKEAGKEFTKGVKVLVDAAVSELEKASKDWDERFRKAQEKRAADAESGSDRPSTTGAQKVKVQVE